FLSMRWLANTPTVVVAIRSNTRATPQVGRSAIDRKVLAGETRTPIRRPKLESSRAAMALPLLPGQGRLAEAVAPGDGVPLRGIVDDDSLLVEQAADRPVVVGEGGAVVDDRRHLAAARLRELVL